MPDKRFADPPINEVVCGVLFEPTDDIDPIMVGRFWETQLKAFPKKQLLPAIVNAAAGGLVIELSPVPQLRTWLVSADDTRVMQIQADRFYLNWRARDAAYPSFNRRDKDAGLLSEMLHAFNGFSSFMKDRAGKSLSPTGVELTMIDIFKQGRHWGDIRDLERLLPSLHPLLNDLDTLPPVASAHVEGPVSGGERRIVFQRVMLRDTGEDAIRLETTIRLQLPESADLEETFKRAHHFLKDEFDRLIPKSEHHRFDTSDWRPAT